jgi:phosphoribosylaminoimidazole carboxylase (NCAIR synthetase)
MHMARKQLNIRLDPDDYEWVMEYAEEREITKTEAGRRLIKTAMDYERGIIKTPAEEIAEDLKQIRTDGGQVRERIDTIEHKQDRLEARHKLMNQGMALGLGYIVFSLAGYLRGTIGVAVGLFVLAVLGASWWLTGSGGGDGD